MSRRQWRPKRTATLVSVLFATLTACAGPSKLVASRGPSATASNPPSSQPGATPGSPSTVGVGGGPAPGVPTSTTYPTLPVARAPGEEPLHCNVGSGLLPKELRPPEGASPSDVAAFQFPPRDASAAEQPVTHSDVEGLIAAFKAMRQLGPDIPVTLVRGSARAAYIPSIRQRWAMATFAPVGHVDPKKLGMNFDPPYDQLVFVQPPACPWTAVYETITAPFPCPDFPYIPVGVQQAWGLKSPPEEACTHAVGGQPITR